MPRRFCENCGSTHLVEDDGVLVCKSCGTIYSQDTIPQYNEIEEQARKEEIERLINANKKATSPNSETEPRIGLLTDEEILKYAPNSYAAKEIKFKNAGSIREKIMYNDWYQIIIMALIPVIIIAVGVLLIWLLTG